MAKSHQRSDSNLYIYYLSISIIHLNNFFSRFNLKQKLFRWIVFLFASSISLFWFSVISSILSVPFHRRYSSGIESWLQRKKQSHALCTSKFNRYVFPFLEKMRHTRGKKASSCNFQWFHFHFTFSLVSLNTICCIEMQNTTKLPNTMHTQNTQLNSTTSKCFVVNG